MRSVRPGAETRWFIKTTGVLVSLLLVAAIATGDYVTGADIAFTHLYLVPIIYGSWIVSWVYGGVVSILCASSWLLIQIQTRRFEVDPVIDIWNVCVQLGIFLTVTGLMGLYKHRLRVERTAARTDDLTGLSNRRLFTEFAQRELARAKRTQQPTTLAYIDLDDFKLLNDSSGHSQGDQALVTVADILKTQSRVTDVAARVGGDEFALLLPDTDPDSAKVAIDRIREKLLDTTSKTDWNIGFSIGVVTFLSSPESLETAIDRVDRLMYTVKHGTKNACCYAVEP